MLVLYALCLCVVARTVSLPKRQPCLLCITGSLSSRYCLLLLAPSVVICVLLSFFFFFSSRRRHTRCLSDWSSDVCSSDLRAGIASPTRAPWIDANGWRFLRRPDAKYVYTVPAGKAALAAAEAFAYGVDAALKIDPADAQPLGAMLNFLADVPAADLPPVADLAVVDDGSPITGEVMNLLVRRNLLFQVVREPSTRLPITVAVGSAEYPRAEAADPSALAQKIRRQLTDERRSLRIYGSEVVI